ncbi:MAG: hypothetical protein ACXIUM_12590 [Wenzhouxiangella sp.]
MRRTAELMNSNQHNKVSNEQPVNQGSYSAQKTAERMRQRSDAKRATYIAAGVDVFERLRG